MMTTGAAITEIIEAYGNRYGQYVTITEIATKTGLTVDQLTEAFLVLLESGDFRCEPEVHRHRVTMPEVFGPTVAVRIAGEDRHKICFEM